MFDYVYELFKPVAGRSGSGCAPFFIHTKCVFVCFAKTKYFNRFPRSSSGKVKHDVSWTALVI